MGRSPSKKPLSEGKCLVPFVFGCLLRSRDIRLWLPHTGVDMIPGVSIPRFRSTARLVAWMRSNKVKERVPAEIERVFLKSKESADRISKSVHLYAQMVGKVSDELEACILEDHVVSYLVMLCRRDLKYNESLLDRLSVRHLVHFSQYVGRLLNHEHKITDPSEVAEYSSHFGPLSEEMERRLHGDPTSIMRYFKVLGRHAQKPPQHLIDAMVGHDSHFGDLSLIIGRLPQHLEESIGDPFVALNYARSVVRGRLPEKVERIFEKNPSVAAAYGIHVVRAWGNPKLPDSLHAAVLLGSVGQQSEEVKRYIAEVDRFSKEQG